MKKLFLFFIFSVTLLISCVDYTDNFNAIDERLDALEMKDIPSIEEQISAINSQLSSLKAIDEAIKTQIIALENANNANVADIAELKTNDQALEKSISDLQNYVDTQIANANSEAAAMYSTIEQYNNIITQLNALQNATNLLGEVLTTKISTEVATLNNIIAELEARLKVVEDKVEQLLTRIQSISYIPTYSDGKATVIYTATESKVSLDFEISPKDAVVELAKVWDSAISTKAIYTQTRAIEYIDMPIVKFEADAENGIISIIASGENLSKEFFSEEQEASIAMTISDGNNSVVSNYIPMTIKNEIKSLLIVADKTTIYDNGTDTATFTLYYDGMTLTEDYALYVGETPLTGNTFASTTQGTYKVWASHGTAISNTVNINVVATPPPAPEAPQDNNPSKTNFRRRIFLTQFTGTGCLYSPLMINAVHQSMTGAYGDDAVLAVAHTYNDNDPAYLYDAQTLDNSLGAYGTPSLFMDLNRNYNTNYYKSDIDKNIQARLDEVTTRGGIAVNSKYYAEEGYIVLNATVKAAQTTEFRVGAWLLEDGIKATQTNNSYTPVDGVDFNTHDDCIRLADSKYTSNNYTGYSIGTIEAGKTASREFAFKLKANGNGSATKWNHDNLKVIVFISTKEDNGSWYVNNVISCPKDGLVDFEYED